MNPTALYKICDIGQATIYMMPKPDSKQLDQDIRFYQSQGVNTVVSLLLPEEVVKHELTQEEDCCRKYSIEYINFSVKDMDVPDLEELKAFNQQLKQRIEDGKSIAIHCHGGRGRAGTVAITLMQEFGFSAAEATKLAQEGRQDANVPVCDMQREFVKNYL